MMHNETLGIQMEMALKCREYVQSMLWMMLVPPCGVRVLVQGFGLPRA